MVFHLFSCANRTRTLLFAASLTITLVTTLQAEPQPTYKPGLGLDVEKEAELADKTGAIRELLVETIPDFNAILPKIRDARHLANELLAMVEETQPKEVDTPDIPARSPVVLLEEIQAKEVLRERQKRIPSCPAR